MANFLQGGCSVTTAIFFYTNNIVRREGEGGVKNQNRALRSLGTASRAMRVFSKTRERYTKITELNKHKKARKCFSR